MLNVRLIDGETNILRPFDDVDLIGPFDVEIIFRDCAKHNLKHNLIFSGNDIEVAFDQFGSIRVSDDELFQLMNDYHTTDIEVYSFLSDAHGCLIATSDDFYMLEN